MLGEVLSAPSLPFFSNQLEASGNGEGDNVKKKIIELQLLPVAGFFRLTKGWDSEGGEASS